MKNRGEDSALLSKPKHRYNRRSRRGTSLLGLRYASLCDDASYMIYVVLVNLCCDIHAVIRSPASPSMHLKHCRLGRGLKDYICSAV